LPEKLNHSTKAEVDHDIMVPDALAALHRAQIPYKTVMAVAHSGQTRIINESHARTMHWRSIQSNLDNTESSAPAFPRIYLVPASQPLMYLRIG
jgi:hypothetical protein